MLLNPKEILKRFYKLACASIFLCQCKLCGNSLVFEDEEIVCRECRDEVILIDAPLCRHCGRIVENRHRICGECIVCPPLYRKHISYSIYDGVLKDLILLFKYGGIKKLKRLLAEYYVELFNNRINEKFDFLIPVPPDKSRRREYNPLYEIAKILSKKLNITVLGDNLIKTKTTEPQAGLSRSKRIKNLDGAFTSRNPSVVEGKKILLIDDVYTTGTTIKKCTEILKKAKADVVTLTLARSI